MRDPLASRVKGLIDGVICALTSRVSTEGATVDVVARQLGFDAPAVASALVGAGRPFGRPRLLAPHGNGVMWLPPDDLLAAGSVVRDHCSSPTLEVAGELLAVERR